MAKPTIKVVEKNEGRKIGYELEGSTLWDRRCDRNEITAFADRRHR